MVKNIDKARAKESIKTTATAKKAKQSGIEDAAMNEQDKPEESVMRGGVSYSTSRIQHDARNKRESSRTRNQKEDDEIKRERTLPERDQRKILDDQYDLMQSKLRKRALAMEKETVLAIEDQEENVNDYGANGSANPNLGGRGGVANPTSATRNEEEVRKKNEKKRKDEDQESEGRNSYATAAATFPSAGSGVSHPTSSNDGSRARRKSNSVDGDSWLRHVQDRAKRALSEGATAGRLPKGSESSGSILARNCRARPGDALSSRGSRDLPIPPRIPQNSNQDGPSSARLEVFTTPLASSVHGSHDDVADNSLRITTAHMERANRELETEWHKKRADHYRD